MNQNLTVVLLLIYAFTLWGGERNDIGQLLQRYSQETDLSQETKRESAGFLTVYTRNDLDRMQIRSLSELIDLIPMLRYNEDNHGLSDPTYADYQPFRSHQVRIYINDREVVLPYYGSGLQMMGTLEIGYIDHVEVYFGIPSFEFGIESSIVVVKAYTKSPQRENGEILGGAIGSYRAHELYVQSARQIDDIAYMAHINFRNNHRKTIPHNGTELSKDQENINFYGEVSASKWRMEAQGIKGRMNQFIGNSSDASSSTNRSSYSYLYMGAYYDDGALKAAVNYGCAKSLREEIDDSLIGIMSSLPLVLYDRYKLELREEIADASLSYAMELGAIKLMTGIRYRYKHFNDTTFQIGGKTYKDFSHQEPYDSDQIVSGFVQSDLLLDDHQMIVASAKVDHYHANAAVSDETLMSGRLGYIYHQGFWTLKTYAFYAQFRPEPQVIYLNEVSLGGPNDLKPERDYAFGSELIFRDGRWQSSLLLSHARSDDTLFNDLNSYNNIASAIKFDAASMSQTWNVDPFNRIDANLNVLYTDYGDLPLPRYVTTLHGYIRSLNTLGNVDVFNQLNYKSGHPNLKPGYNFSTAVTYHASRQLNLYLKGVNVFDSALKSYYRRYDFITQQQTVVSNVSSFDRSIWIGMEYLF